MSDISFECAIDTTVSTAELKLSIVVDNLTVFDQIISQPTKFQYSLNDDPGQHELKFILSNKHCEHTKIDGQGNIIEDACVVITDIKFAGVELGQIVSEQMSYTHDYNGTGQLATEKFYSHMGCNGTASLKFTTPVYLWMLEHR